MQSEDLQELKDQKIRLVVSQEDNAALPAADEGVQTIEDSAHTHKAASAVPQLTTHRDEAERLLKELPTEEFLNLLERSSPEQLQAFLQALGPSSEKSLLQGPNALLSALLSIPEEPRGAMSIIAWWESRRLVFNLIVGLCGLPTLALIYLTGLAHLGIIISGTIEYGLLANICYTAGWLCELVARSWWKERAKHLGPMLFSLGLAFSVLLTLAAGLIVILIFLALSFTRP